MHSFNALLAKAASIQLSYTKCRTIQLQSMYMLNNYVYCLSNKPGVRTNPGPTHRHVETSIGVQFQTGLLGLIQCFLTVYGMTTVLSLNTALWNTIL